jgi:hypothetical protein
VGASRNRLALSERDSSREEFGTRHQKTAIRRSLFSQKMSKEISFNA